MTDTRIVLGLVFIGVVAYLALISTLAEHHSDDPKPPDDGGRPKAKKPKGK